MYYVHQAHIIQSKAISKAWAWRSFSMAPETPEPKHPLSTACAVLPPHRVQCGRVAQTHRLTQYHLWPCSHSGEAPSETRKIYYSPLNLSFYLSLFWGIHGFKNTEENWVRKPVRAPEIFRNAVLGSSSKMETGISFIFW